MNVDGNLAALDRYEREQEKKENELERIEGELDKELEPIVAELNAMIKNYGSDMKEHCREYVIETIENLLER